MTEIMKPESAQHVQDMVLSTDHMKQALSFAGIMAAGKATVPKHLQGSEPDCLAVTLQAMQWGMNPFAVAQKTHIVSGTLGYEAQLVNAVVSSSRAIQGRFKYEYGGDWEKSNAADAWVRAGAIIRGEEEITWGEKLYPAKVTTKNSPLWKTAPKQQAAYLAVKYWARLYCPEVILGVYSSDDLVKQQPQVIDKGAAIRADITPEPEQEQEKEVKAIESDSDSSTDLEMVLRFIEQAQNETMLGAAREAGKNHIEAYPADVQKIAESFKKRRKELGLDEK